MNKYNEVSNLLETTESGYTEIHITQRTDSIEILRAAINCILLQLIALVGIVANILTLIVLHRNGFKDANNILLFSMAAFDLLSIVTVSIRKLSYIFKQVRPEINKMFYPYATCSVSGLGRFALIISTAHVVVVSLERFLAVFFPFNVSHWVTRKRMTASLTIIVLSWLLVTSPYVFMYLRVEWSFDAKINITVPELRITDFYTRNEQILSFIDKVIINTLGGPVSILVVLTSCCLIFYKLRNVSRRRRKLCLKQHQSGIDMKVSRTLLAVCIVYIPVNVYGYLLYLAYYNIPKTDHVVQILAVFSDFEECLWVLNSAVNFFIYTFMSTKFYVSVKNLLSCK